VSVLVIPAAPFTTLHGLCVKPDYDTREISKIQNLILTRSCLGLLSPSLESRWNLALAIQEILNRPQWKFLRLDLIGPEELPGGYPVDCD
jgi:hypothetical protein